MSQGSSNFLQHLCFFPVNTEVSGVSVCLLGWAGALTLPLCYEIPHDSRAESKEAAMEIKHSHFAGLPHSLPIELGFLSLKLF